MTGEWHSMSWGELLAALRRDLQLDPGTDLIGGALARINAQNAGISWGVLDGTTPAISNAGSGDWTFVKNAVGSYTISNPKWPAGLAPFLTCSGAALALVCSLSATAAGSFGATIFKSTTGADTDAFLFFLVVY